MPNPAARALLPVPDPAALVAALTAHKPRTAPRVLAVLAELGWSEALLDQLAPPLAANQTPYMRHVLGSTAEWEVMVARWRPGVPCAPHDHGAAGGWVVFARGTFVETLWTARDGGYEAASERTHRAPAVSRVAPGAFHHCVCADEGLSLHIYTPAIARMQVLDSHARCTLQLADHCGAWLPQLPTDVLATTSW